MGFLKCLKEGLYDEEREDVVEEPQEYDFQGQVDMSAELGNADEYLYSNSEPMTYYANGNGFELTDNDQLYEIIKLVHELTDKHFFVRDLTWKANIKHRYVEFIFKLGEGDDEADKFFLDGVHAYLNSEILKNFGPLYNVYKEPFVDSVGKNSAKITVKKKSEEEKHV